MIKLCELKQYEKRFFIHTPKAIKKAGGPSYRLFCTIKHTKIHRRNYLFAWIVDRKTEDIFSHPVLGDVHTQDLQVLDLCISIDEGLSIVKTHDLRNLLTYIPCDSYYRLVTLQEAIEKLVPADKR